MDTLISWIASPIPFIVLISIVITVHELGHYWVGRMFGAAAESFSIGFGRPIVQFKDKRGTRWRINWLPLGGFVKFVGEAQLANDIGKVEQGPVGRIYTDLNPWERMAVSVGGPVANFIFAIVVMATAAMTLGLVEVDQVRVAGVLKGSVAEGAGFKPGDVLLKANDRIVKGAEDVQIVTKLNAGDPVAYLVRRDGQEVMLTAVPKETTTEDTELRRPDTGGKIGVELQPYGSHVRRLNPLDATAYGVAQVGDTIGMTTTVIRRLFMGKEGLDKFSGPVGVFSMTDAITDYTMKQQGVPLWERVAQTLISLIKLAAVLSIGVGFFNLLPIPVLDGGAIVLCLAEGLTRREIPERVQRVALIIGGFCLLLFAVVITGNDILRFRIG